MGGAGYRKNYLDNRGNKTHTVSKAKPFQLQLLAASHLSQIIVNRLLKISDSNYTIPHKNRTIYYVHISNKHETDVKKQQLPFIFLWRYNC